MQDAAIADPPPGTLEQGLEAAHAALTGGDLAAALAVFADLRARFPDAVPPFQRAAFAVLEAGRFDEADALLQAAMARFPDDVGLAVDHAWVAHRRRTVAAAIARWDRVRQGFPDHPMGYIGAAITAREAGQLDRADALLTEAERRFPDNPSLPAEQAWLALARRDLPAAIRRWEEVRVRQPDSWLGYTGGSAALREAQRFVEADALLAEAIVRFPAEPAPLFEYAQQAAVRRDWPEALRRWQTVVERHPNRIDAIAGQALALRESGRFDDADAVLTAALARFPANPHLNIDFAWVAHIRRDWPTAAARWDRVRHHVPEFVPAFIQGAIALREAGRLPEADTLLASALEQFPDSPDPALEHARLAQSQRAWPEAAFRWQRVRTRFPDAWPAYVGLAVCHREQGQIAEAEAVLRDAADRFPGQLEPLAELAWLVTHQHRHDDADALWSRVRTAFPGHAVGFTGGVVALGDARRFDAAVALLDEAATRFPNDPGPPTERGWLAMNQSDFAAAERIFRAAGDRFPGHPIVPLGLGRALRAQNRIAEAATVLRSAIERFPGFGLLATDLAELPEAAAPETPTPEPPPPPPAPTIVRAMPLKVAVTGFHLATQISQIVAALPPLRDRVRVQRLDVGASVEAIRSALPDRFLEGADLYFEESLVGSAQVKGGIRSALPASCEIRTFPTTYVRVLWPFHGRDDRLVPEPPVYNGGRYSHTDPIAASLAGTEMTDDALFDAYMELSEAAPLDLDAIYATDVERWRREDGLCDIQLAPFIEANFRDQYLFTTPNERGTPIVREIALQAIDMLAAMGAADAPALHQALAKLLHGWRASKHAVPVHPRVGRHFGLGWWSPDMRYRMLANEFTFRDYIIRYIRWSPWLP